MILSPIVLFVYNRPWHTEQTLEALSNNQSAKESILYIYSDGPKGNSDQKSVSAINEVRKVIRAKNWCKEVHIIESEINLGLANSIIKGVTEVINAHGKIIVLEDDIVISKYFLDFMNNSLNKYQNEPMVGCISGYLHPAKYNFPETFFVKGAECWGWATWKRAWDIFEPNGAKLAEEICRTKRVKEFTLDNAYDYYQMLLDQVNGKNNSWAVRWHASTFIKDMLCLYPGKTHVINIGFDGSGTHCDDRCSAEKTTITFNVSPNTNYTSRIQEDTLAKKAFSQYFFSFHPSFYQKLKTKIKKFIPR